MYIHIYTHIYRALDRRTGTLGEAVEHGVFERQLQRRWLGARLTREGSLSEGEMQEYSRTVASCVTRRVAAEAPSHWEKIFIELMTLDRTLKASWKGAPR